MTKDNGVIERFRERFTQPENENEYIIDSKTDGVVEISNIEAFLLEEVQRGKEEAVEAIKKAPYRLLISPKDNTVWVNKIDLLRKLEDCLHTVENKVGIEHREEV